MALKRTNPRRTVTLSGLSFAEGAIELIHPQDVPYHMLASFHQSVDEAEAINSYYLFCREENLISDEELMLLIDLTADETVEVWEALSAIAVDDYAPSGLIPKDSLSPEEEEVANKFADMLNGMFPGMNPPGDKPDTDLADEIDKVLGEDGDEPTD